MKKALTVLYSTLCLLQSTLLIVIPTLGGISTAFAQESSDSVRITHTQETGTLEKQRFIDRYDYVFMTKEPTKWVGKIFTNLSAFEVPKSIDKDYFRNNTDLRVGVEHKVTPSFSIGLDIARNKALPFRKSRFYDENPYQAYIYFAHNLPKGRWITSIDLKWYYDMALRIRQGKSVNNFSGNYFSLKFEKAWNEENFSTTLFRYNETDYYAQYYSHQVSLSYGIQRRFFQFGLADFSISLNRSTDQIVHRKLSSLDNNTPIKFPIQWSTIKEEIFYKPDHNWSISTNFKVGIAFADIVKGAQTPYCEAFQCLVNEQSLWKFSWPQLRLSPVSQTINGSIGFEQKILRSAFSLNTYWNYSLNHLRQDSFFETTPTLPFTYSIVNFINLQPRWYFLMRTLNKAGKVGNNLSGPYAGLNILTVGIYSKSKSLQVPFRYCYTGALVGFQQKIFNRGFIDISLSKPFHESAKSLTAFYNKRPVFDFKLGFAL